jgi:hypothetical protein
MPVPVHRLQVILAANNGPTINDITAAELAPLVQTAAGVLPLVYPADQGMSVLQH